MDNQRMRRKGPHILLSVRRMAPHYCEREAFVMGCLAKLQRLTAFPVILGFWSPTKNPKRFALSVVRLSLVRTVLFVVYKVWFDEKFDEGLQIVDLHQNRVQMISREKY